MRCVWVYLVVLIAWSPAWAAPSISSTSGTLTHGSSITISGSSFGAKGGTNANKPLIWADFETSINPTSLGHITAWDATQNLTRASAAPQYGLSTNNVVGTWDIGTLTYSFGFTLYHDVTTIYMYGKRRYSADASANKKFFRIWSDNLGDTVASTSNGGIVLDENCVQSGRFQGVTLGANAWLQHEFLWRQSTSGTCSGTSSTGNGYYEFIQNGVQQQAFIDTLATELPAAAVYGSAGGNGIRLFDNFTDSGDVEADGTKVYMDDLYMDNTFARVMLGNASTFAASTTREIQVPTAWGASSITVQLNRGSFGASDAVWLYVIDSTNVPSAGYAVTLGGGGSGTPSLQWSGSVQASGSVRMP